MKNFFLKTGLTLLCLIIGLGSAWGETVTYKQSSTTAASVTSGTAPTGSSVTFNNTYTSNKEQLTKGNTMTLTLSGYAGKKITSVILSMHSNKSAGTGYLSIKAGSTILASVGSSGSPVAFNQSEWNGAWSQSYTNVSPSMSNNSYTIQNGENVVITIGATVNSLFCESFTINYESASSKPLSSIAIKTAPNKVTYTEGDTFDPAGLVITGTYSDSSTEDIAYADHASDFTFSPELTTELTPSNTSVTITYEGKTANQAISVTAFTPTAGTYTINTNNSLYGISTGNNGTEQSEVKNGITIVSGCSSNAQSKTYYDTNHIRYYKDSYLKLTAPTGYEITKVAFTDSGTWNSGPNCGSNGSYNNETKTWEGNATQLNLTFSDQNRIASIEVTYAKVSTPTKTLTGITITGTPAEFWKGDTFNHNGITVTANYDDSSSEDVTNTATFSTPDMSTAGEKTVTVTYQDQTDTYNINVNTIANTQATAYTVAKAKELIDAGKDLNTKVYVAGKVSQVDSYNDSYNSITYWISADGTTTDQFEVYGGLAQEGESFTSKDDVQVGADVIVYGTITKFNSTYEFAQNSNLVSYSYTPPTTDFIKTPTATVKVLDPISIKDYINGEYTSYEISTSINGETQKDNEFVCIYDQIRFCKGGTYVVDVTGTSGSETKTGTVTFTVTPTGAELSSVTISGTPKTTYTVGDAFDFAGLTLTANCSDGSSADVTEEAEWEAEPATFTEAGTTTVVVMGTYCGESDIQEYTVTVNAAPQSVTWDLTKDETVTATEDEISWTSDAVSMIDTKGEGGTAANNYYPGTPNKTYTSTRFYNGSTLTITPANGITITSIVFEATSTNYASTFAGSNWNETATANANNETVTVTPENGTLPVTAQLSGTAGFNSVTVYYTGTPVVLTLDHITISGYTTTFTEGDTFNFGGTVTAHYNDESTKDVTSSATFTGYDMSTAGTQTVTVSYTENEVTKNATYDITVAEGEHGEYVLTSLADINAEDEVIITMTNSDGTYAISNNNGTTDAPTAVPVTISSNSISSPDATILWNISKQPSGDKFIIHPKGIEEKWLYCTNSNNGVRVGEGDAKLFIIKDNYLYEDGTADARYIGVYDNADFRCYKTIDESSNIKGQTLAFYVKPGTPVEKEYYTVTIDQEDTHGTIKLMNGDTEVESGSTVEEGTTLTIVATPAEGYVFKNWQYKEEGGSWVTKHTNYEYTVESNVSFRANFEELARYTVTFDPQAGTCEETTLEETVAGAGVTLPAAICLNKDYEFAGWATEVCEETTTMPTLYAANSTYNPTSDVTLYAVYTTEGGTADNKFDKLTNLADLENGDEIVIVNNASNYVLDGNSLGGSTEQSTIADAASIYVSDASKIWTATTTGSNVWQFENSITKIGISSLPGADKKAYLWVDGANNTWNIETSNTSNCWTIINTGEKEGGHAAIEIVFDEKYEDGDKWYAINKANPDFDDYCANRIYVKAPGAAQIYNSNPCEFLALRAIDDDKATRWATYSNDENDVEFIEGATVYSVTAENGKITLYEESDIVPAGTGVLLKFTESSVRYVTTENADALKNTNNMLRPSSAPMNDSGYMYYKLAYEPGGSKTGLGFYYGAEDGAPFASAAGLAYLAIPASQEIRGFSFGEALIETAISTVATEVKPSANTYDLQGRLTKANTRGLFIVNGKKIIK